MALRLYYNSASQHSRRDQVAVIELGLDVELKPVDFMKGEHKAPDFLAHNPNGKVPLLEHDGLWLWESNAIMAYLADLRPERGLYPTEPRARADVNRWLFWEAAHFGPACLRLTWERVMKPTFMKQDPNPVLVADGEQNLQRFAAVLDSQLAGKEYVTGRLSIADFALASVLAYRVPARMELGAFPQLRGWLGRIEARESWKQTAPRF
ncbi:MAG: glutathione S-transferase family protein [Deltaproteobacteria bacterium]|nr:glutathione S-transferase family protein [Deltaproteobacteria bacterium]